MYKSKEIRWFFKENNTTITKWLSKQGKELSKFFVCPVNSGFVGSERDVSGYEGLSDDNDNYYFYYKHTIKGRDDILSLDLEKPPVSLDAFICMLIKRHESASASLRSG